MLLNEKINQSYDKLKEAHIKDYQSLFDRVAIRLGEERDQKDLPTDERLTRVKNGEVDQTLLEIYFNFGRYLLISSSRPGSLPANLQGIWKIGRAHV